MIAYVPGEVILGTDYVVTRRLGSGGQGEVYRKEENDKSVANALAAHTPLLVPPKGATFATTDPDPPRTSPPASAARPSAPTPSQNAKMRAAATQEQPLPPPTERVNPDGSTKKSTGTKPMSEAYKREREPQGPRASTAFMAEAPTLPWYSGLQRRCSNAWQAARHPVEAWETWKYRRELNESDTPRGRGPLALGALVRAIASPPLEPSGRRPRTISIALLARGEAQRR